METISASFEMMMNDFTDADELMNFAAAMGIQDSPIVRFRLFQLRNPDYGNDFVMEQCDAILEELCDSEEIERHKEIEACVKAYLFDEEADEATRQCIEDGEWNPASPLQVGGGEEPQPGPSGLQYVITKKGERTYAKNAAVDRTYKIKIDENHNGQQLQDVRDGLHHMFQDVLEEVRGNLAGNDLGRVVIHHPGLHDPIVVPLQPWDELTADKSVGDHRKGAQQ